MRDFEFESSIRNALAPEEAGEDLAARIDAKVQRHRQRSLANRRVGGVTLAVGLLVAIGFMLSTSSAEAALRRMAGAIDGIDRMAVRFYSVGTDGKLRPYHEVSYDQAKWRLDDAMSGEVSLWSAGKLLVSKPQFGCYVSVDSPNGPGTYNPKSMKLSEVVGLGNSGRQIVQIDHVEFQGRGALRATVESPYVNERQVIYADARSELPIEMQAYSNEGGKWILKVRAFCDYDPKFPPHFFLPDTKLKVLSEEQFEKNLVAKLCADELATVPLGHGRLVIRAIDVAVDGTVFVAYQSGDRAANSWKGIGLSISDSLGTRYAFPLEVFSSIDEATIYESKDGKLELEAFVPLEPRPTWEPREVRISANISASGKLVRSVRMGVGTNDRDMSYRIGPNRFDKSEIAAKRVLSRLFAKPTCREAPDYASIVNLMDFGGDLQAEMYKARTRAREYHFAADWANAERWIREGLRLQEKLSRSSASPYSIGEDLENLKKVQEHRFPN